MKLDDYLARINFRGDIQVDFDCLRRIHRSHALSVPYENLDVQLQRPVDQDIKRIFDKIVTRNRGGWCYEQNGLLAWALKEIGFEVTRVVGAMERREEGDQALGNHLLLLVKLDMTYVADLGVGDGAREPLPLVEGMHQQGEFEFRLEIIEDGYWRFHNHSFGVPTTFDFKPQAANEDLISRMNFELQTNPDAMFVQNFVAQIMRENSITCLTGKVMREKTAQGTKKSILSSAQELEDTLSKVFGIRNPQVQSIWPRIEARHTALFGDRPLQLIDTSDFEF